jgi:dihydroorotase-like cyclic amidohydrolase
LGKERKLAVSEPADITMFSLDRVWTYNVKESASKSRNSPFDCKSFKGGPAATIVAGKIVYGV